MFIYSVNLFNIHSTYILPLALIKCYKVLKTCKLVSPKTYETDENFLDANLVSQAGMLTQPLDIPLNASALNGKLLA